MSRQIKVRVWDKVAKEMIHPDGNEHYNFEICAYDGVLYFHDIEKGRPGEDYEILLYTGLKDKSGVEIYEGDIVRQYPKEGYGNIIMNGDLGEVYYSYGAFVIKNINDRRTHFFFYTEQEVIGNIYENPELLENA